MSRLLSNLGERKRPPRRRGRGWRVSLAHRESASPSGGSCHGAFHASAMTDEGEGRIKTGAWKSQEILPHHPPVCALEGASPAGGSTDTPGRTWLSPRGSAGRAGATAPERGKALDRTTSPPPAGGHGAGSPKTLACPKQSCRAVEGASPYGRNGLCCAASCRRRGVVRIFCAL